MKLCRSGDMKPAISRILNTFLNFSKFCWPYECLEPNWGLRKLKCFGHGLLSYRVTAMSAADTNITLRKFLMEFAIMCRFVSTLTDLPDCYQLLWFQPVSPNQFTYCSFIRAHCTQHNLSQLIDHKATLGKPQMHFLQTWITFILPCSYTIGQV